MDNPNRDEDVTQGCVITLIGVAVMGICLLYWLCKHFFVTFH